MTAIEFVGASKVFRRNPQRHLLRALVAELLRRDKQEGFYALRDVSFRIDHGERVAVVGPNGAGKSTLLSLVTGLAPPDEGVVTVNGRLAPLLELGSGFHLDLTGAENLRLNAALLGLSRRRIEDVFHEIVEFSELGDFISQPLRTYSSGMVMRLAFSIAVQSDPDIVLIDEVLAVGDAAFQTKCINKLASFRDAGKTLLLVSHSSLVKDLCDRALWLDHGRLMMDGKVGEVLDAYHGRQPLHAIS